jgi:biopolymer transport protein ExbB
MDPSTEVGFLMSIIMGAGTLLKLGGVVVGILLLASIFGLALAGQKFLQFRRASPAVVSELDRAVGLWHKGEQKEARELLIESELTVATDIRFGLEKHGTMNPDLLHDELLRRASTYLRGYSQNLRLIELIYYLAPVMGLLGTVLGMIDAFRGLAVSAGASGESSALASGIWEALLTTAVGLSIAIPFAVMHAVLEAKLEMLTDQVSDLVTRILTFSETS